MDKVCADEEKSWELAHQQHQWGTYPPEEVIRFVARNYYKAASRPALRFLDLGCGGGACSWFLGREGFNVTGIDCSPTAIEKAKRLFVRDSLKGDFRVGSIFALPYADGEFDCVIDSGCITSVPFKAAFDAIAEVRRVLKSGGRYFGYYIGKKSSLGDSLSPDREDPHYYLGGLGSAATARLYDDAELQQLLAGFAELQIDESTFTAHNRTSRTQILTPACVKR